MTTILLLPSRSARSRSRSTVASSAHWRSSSTTSSGLAPCEATSTSKTALNSDSRRPLDVAFEPSVVPRTLARRLGTSSASMAPLLAASSCMGLCVALQLVVAGVGEVNVGPGPHQLANDLGNEHLPALGLARHARGHVDSRAEEVARLLDDLAGVDADADPEPAVWVRLAVVGDRSLDVERALDRVPRRAEAHHHAVAETLDAPSRVLGDLLADDGLVGLHDLVRLGEAARRQQVGRAFDVGEHDRDRAFGLTRREAADDRLRRQRRRRVDGLAEPCGDLAKQ